jgi:bacterial/archaeal transporter family-2 protein
MDILYIAIALLAGACAPTQAGINSQLRVFTEDPVLAALVSFAVGTMGLFVYVLLLRIPWPSFQNMLTVPYWMWTGGFLGAFLVVVTVILAPKMGAATMLAFLIAGQMVTSLVLDQYGLIGYPPHPTSVARLLGVMLVVVGVVLIKKF